MAERDARTAEESDLGGVLVRICDLAGRVRGMGFAADADGTVLTSHEAVDGLPRLVLHAPGDRVCVVTPEAVTGVPGSDLALIRTEGLDLPPLPVTVRDSIPAGSYVRIAAEGWREARVLGRAPVTYTSTDRFHLVTGAVELAVGTEGSDALRLGGHAAGGPVLDAATGSVLAVLGSALQAGHGAAGFAVTPRDAAAGEPGGPIARLLARNAATVPGFGADLNLAGVLQLTATATGSDGPRPCPLHVERPLVAQEFRDFLAGDRAVLGLVGAPGSGRTTELAALAAQRAGGSSPGPTLWLRGADLRADDTSIAEAVARALNRAARILAASAAAAASPAPGADPDHPDPTGTDPQERGALRPATAPRGTEPPGPTAPGRTARTGAPGGREEVQGRARPRAAARTPEAERAPEGLRGPTGHRRAFGDISPDRVARLARDAGRPLLLLLDGPEEMPAALAQRLADWSAAGSGWLRDTGAQLVVACRAEHWEQAGAHFPARQLYGRGTGQLPACVRLGPLTGTEASRLRALHGLDASALDPAGARHPLALRLLADVRRAMPGQAPGRPTGEEILGAHLDLVCLRIAARLAQRQQPTGGRAVARLAARVSGQVHEAARRCLAPGQGELDRAGFEELFPWSTGWAAAVLAEGLFVPAGEGYRFADEEVGDWIQGTHLDLDAALRALVHARRTRPEEAPAPRSAVPQQRRRRSQRRRPPQPEPPLPLPRHRIGPVVQAMLLLARERGPARLGAHLAELIEATDELTQVGEHGEAAAGDAVWWSARLLAEALTRSPDARPHLSVLRMLAGRVVVWRTEGRRTPGDFGPDFWAALALPEEERFDLLRRLVVADGAPGSDTRYLDAVAALLRADPVSRQRRLTDWFGDERKLAATPAATVAAAAQALLHTHRGLALDELVEALVDCAHVRADELLATLAQEEPSALCRAVDRWAHDERPARQVAASAYGTLVARHARLDADRELLRLAALALLERAGDRTLHGSALALLVRDPLTRGRYLPEALRHFATGQARLPFEALLLALPTDPEAVLASCRTRLLRSGGRAEATELLTALAEVTSPASSRRVATLVREVLRRRPELAPAAAAYLEQRLEQGDSARSVLLPLVTEVLREEPAEVRAEIAATAGSHGTAASRALRAELLELLIEGEHDPEVLVRLLGALAESAEDRGDPATRELVHRTGLRMARSPQGAARLDRGLVELARRVPGFAALLARWLGEAPGNWSPLLGPGARRTIENLAAEPVAV
ncbi:trypsin-like peptidase domain-containing protein [Streptomyces physcomitrii]|uniref:trypsin-like peptidase domain-containing protein n=1 Tax=Streptomyces physcomitrii TaxID=2724184 RepID=UPI003426540A